MSEPFQEHEPKDTEEITTSDPKLKLLGMISYFFVGFLLASMFEKEESKFLRIHIRQGAFLFACWFLAFSLIFMGIFGYWLFALATIVYLVMGGIAAYTAFQGEVFEYGFIGVILGIFNKKKEDF